MLYQLETFTTLKFFMFAHGTWCQEKIYIFSYSHFFHIVYNFYFLPRVKRHLEKKKNENTDIISHKCAKNLNMEQAVSGRSLNMNPLCNTVAPESVARLPTDPCHWLCTLTWYQLWVTFKNKVKEQVPLSSKRLEIHTFLQVVLFLIFFFPLYYLPPMKRGWPTRWR